jgi:hypothetical protein
VSRGLTRFSQKQEFCLRGEKIIEFGGKREKFLGLVTKVCHVYVELGTRLLIPASFVRCTYPTAHGLSQEDVNPRLVAGAFGLQPI